MFMYNLSMESLAGWCKKLDQAKAPFNCSGSPAPGILQRRAALK